MLPAAAPLFSITMVWPRVLRMRSVMMRPIVSVGPPAAAPTTTVIGRDGYVCALAIRVTTGSAAAPAARCRNCRRRNRLMAFPRARADRKAGVDRPAQSTSDDFLKERYRGFL